MPRQNNFDEKCYETAEHFLPRSATEQEKEALADWIQDAIESWLEAHNTQPRKPVQSAPVVFDDVLKWRS